MTSLLAATRPAGNLYRVARLPDAWAWPSWEYAGEDATFGNRYDDPRGEYRVLYATSQRLGAFIETLAPYRADPAVIADYDQITVDPDDAKAFPTLAPGVVPHGWRAARAIGTARHPGPFADVGHSTSLAHLRAVFARRLAQYQLDDLDGGDLRRRAPRAFTQEVSRYVFEHGATSDGQPLLGIHYLSRLGDDIDNWAIFEGTEPEEATTSDIADDDPDLHAALSVLELVMAST
jgi:hypothetical protein